MGSKCSPVLCPVCAVASCARGQPRLLGDVRDCGGSVAASAVPASHGAYRACCMPADTCAAVSDATPSRSRHCRCSSRPAVWTSAFTAAYAVRKCCQPRWLTLRSMMAVCWVAAVAHAQMRILLAAHCRLDESTDVAAKLWLRAHDFPEVLDITAGSRRLQ